MKIHGSIDATAMLPLLPATLLGYRIQLKIAYRCKNRINIKSQLSFYVDAISLNLN